MFLRKLRVIENKIIFRKLRETDIEIIIKDLRNQGIQKSHSLLNLYILDQIQGKRIIYVAYLENSFAGYITLVWKSRYKPFYDADIPEIVDLIVLPSYRNMGIGSQLIDIAEKESKLKSSLIGLGVGLNLDYGKAQQLYFYKGFVPDGRGITYNNHPIKIDQTIKVDDNLLLWLVKRL